MEPKKKSSEQTPSVTEANPGSPNRGARRGGAGGEPPSGGGKVQHRVTEQGSVHDDALSTTPEETRLHVTRRNEQTEATGRAVAVQQTRGQVDGGAHTSTSGL